MATRTVTKTKASTKLQKGKERAEQANDEEQEPAKKKRSAGNGYKLGATSTSKNVASTSSKARKDPDDADSSSPESENDEDDDFSRDVLEDIAKDIEEREYTKLNGKRRKQPAKTKADKQTAKTRAAYSKGQGREYQTSKWARRERQLNPVVKLLKVDFTIMRSDTESSEGSVDTDNADDLSDVSRQIFNLSHRRQYRRKYGHDQAGSTKKKSAQKPMPKKRFSFGLSSDEDGKENHPRSTKSSPSKTKTGDSSSATEDSDAPIHRPKKIKVKKEEDDSIFAAKEEEDVKPDISKLMEDDEDSDMSDDVSPMNPEAYQAQKRRRDERFAQKKARLEGRPYIKSEPKSPTFSSLPGRAVKEEEEDLKPVLRHTVKQEAVVELLDDDDDSDTPPDYAVTDPRYAAWVNRKQATLPANFQPFIQKTHKPFLEIKSHQQASIGPLILGKDPNQGNRNVQVPASINRFLRNYQRDGVKFFWKHYAKGEGGLLGDDMGLGKTIQVISFLSAIMGHNCTEAERDRRRERLNKADCPIPEKPTDLGPTALIIAPASVVDNWAREIETWTYLSAGVYRSTAAKEVLKDFKRGRLDILICGIDAARKQIDEICYLDFSCIIVDEVHKVKNHLSKTTLAFKKFACQVRFGLTGTAMQNRYIEMHTVLDWCFPTRLGTRAQWMDYVDTPLKTAQRKDATQEQLALGRHRAVTLVHDLLPNFFIRRTKELIADQLPKKTDQIVFCPLSEDQKKAYCQLLAHPEINTILTHDEPCPCGNRDPNGLPYQRSKCCDEDWHKPILKWISIFCKVANHAVLIYPDKRDRQINPVKFLQDQQITKCAFPDSYKNRGQDRVASSLVDMDSSLCGKWDVLKGLLARWYEKGDKVLLFSRSTRLLDALEHWIEMIPYNMVRLDGSIPAEKRLSLCDDFNDPAGDKFLFLISTLAGGVGLNLTSANRVVIFDPNWNPVADLQAMDRSYRWGQLRDVTVYRLIGAGSLEELIYSRQIYKQHQAEIAYEAAAPSRMFIGVEGDKKRQGELFGVKNLFRFNPRTSRTKMSIEEAQISELGFALMNHATKSKKRKRGGADDSDDEPVESSQTEEGLVDNEAALEAMLNTGANLKHEEEDDEIARILKNNGVSYTHQHTNLVKNSVVEAQISKAAMREYKDVQKRGAVANQRASTAKVTAKVKSASSWAPSKGASKASAASKPEPPSLTPFEMLFEGGQVRMDDLADLAEALDFDSAGGLARAYAAMNPAQQEELLVRAKEIVERI